jgi:hypothetical protein
LSLWAFDVFKSPEAAKNSIPHSMHGVTDKEHNISRIHHQKSEYKKREVAASSFYNYDMILIHHCAFNQIDAMIMSGTKLKIKINPSSLPERFGPDARSPEPPPLSPVSTATPSPLPQSAAMAPAPQHDQKVVEGMMVSNSSWAREEPTGDQGWLAG